jgi:hypothetical protein
VAVGVLEAVAQGMALEDNCVPWPAAERTYDATLPTPLPDALTAAVRLRFHELSPLDRDLLAVVAVHEVPATAERLAGLLQVMPDAVNAALDTLEWDRWLVVDSRGYRFRTRAVGTLVAREMLTPGQRQRLQARLRNR